MPTVAATAAVVALISGVVVSTVEARHHKSHKTATTNAGTISAEQQQSIAHQLNTMVLPKGVAHTTVCPRVATPTDACFSSTLAAPPPSLISAAADAERLLTSLGVTLGVSRNCAVVTGGPEGAGYDCVSTGTWHGSVLATEVFVSNAAQKPAGVPALLAIVSVSSRKSG